MYKLSLRQGHKKDTAKRFKQMYAQELEMQIQMKVKVKLSLCLTKHHLMKAYWGSGGIGPRILDLGTRCR
jgi:hypothetical protein